MTQKKGNKKGKKRVLHDHARVGKRFVPPFIHRLGNLHETSWVDVTLPEILWIACLNHEWGFARGAALAVALSAATRECVPDAKGWFPSVSSYEALTGEQQAAVAENLEKNRHMCDLRRGFLTLQGLYPKAPFGFLYDENPPRLIDRSAALKDFKSMLVELFDKTTRQAIFAQGTVVYLGVVAGKVFVKKGLMLANLPALKDYPQTEESKLVAAAVRSATSMMLLEPDKPHDTAWAEYFWNRGLELEPCQLPSP